MRHESIGSDAEVGDELDQELVPLRHDDSAEAARRQNNEFFEKQRRSWRPYPGALSPQNFPIRRELSVSPPLNSAT